MSDSKPPKPSQPPVLPRTWKAPVEPVEEPKPAAKSKKGKDQNQSGKNKEAAGKPDKKKKKSADFEATDENSASKLEGTPLLDTYEARQRIRWVLGGVISLIGIVVILVLVNRFQPAPPPADTNTDKKDMRTTVDPKESLEREAAMMVENAKQADRLGRYEAAINSLRKVVRNYDGTAAAKEAKAALARESQNRPMFGPDPTQSPTGPVTPKQPTGPSIAGEAPGPAPPMATATAPVAPTSPLAPPKPPEIVVRPLPNGFRAEADTAIHATGWPLRIICDRDKATMVFVPAAEFIMGREDGSRSERPSHRVKLSAFYIDEHEVTGRQYLVYLEDTGRPLKSIPAERLDLPMTGLNAREAQEYCKWANRRLPTEAQWEMAARSTEGKISYGGSKEPTKGDANTRSLDPVMANPADRSPLGGFDFSGNASEWTADYYDSSYYNSLKDLTTDPTGPLQSRIRPAQATIKGGASDGSLTWRQGVPIESHLPTLGFRGILQAEIPAAAPSPGAPNGPGAAPAGGAVPF